MNWKRIFRYRCRNNPFPMLVFAAIALAILSTTVFSRAYQPPLRKFASHATAMPRQTVGVVRHFRPTKAHITAAINHEYSRFSTAVHHRRRHNAARLLGLTQLQLCRYKYYNNNQCLYFKPSIPKGGGSIVNCQGGML